MNRFAFPLIVLLAPAATAALQVTNLGVSSHFTARCGDHLLYPVAGGSLRVRTLSTGQTNDTGLSASVLDGSNHDHEMPFLVKETTQDLNGDGDKIDFDVLHLVHVDPPTCGAVYPYGAACSGGLAQAPQLAATGGAAAGQNFGLSLTGGPANGLWLVFAGLRHATIPTSFGCELVVDPVGSFVLPLGLSASGTASLSGSLPPSAAGAKCVTQAFALGAGPPTPFATTSGLEFHVVP